MGHRNAHLDHYRVSADGNANATGRGSENKVSIFSSKRKKFSIPPSLASLKITWFA